MSGARDIMAVADEYVLGLLDPAEEAEVTARIEREPALRGAVGAARDRFIELDLAGKAAPAPSGLWSRIAAELGSVPQEGPRLSEGPVAGGGEAGSLHAAYGPSANDNAADRWRRRALAATAASLLLAAGLGVSLFTAAEPVVVAVLVNADGEPQALVEDFGDTSARVTPLVDFPVPAGRTMQVWTLPSDELGPVSLGLLGRSQGELLDGPDLPAPKADQLYEITLEQAGGSPTGRPTGPILVKGFAKVPR